ncbi:MAG: adenylate/guanylate cyclase domain-containing protein, partial [Sciscionella sp.]
MSFQPSAELAHDLEEALLGGKRRYTRSDVGTHTGVDPEHTKKLWLAMGFATVEEDEIAFTDADVAALRTLNELIDAGLVPLDSVLSQSRAMGQTLSRLAEWQTRAMTARIRELAGTDEQAQEMTTGILPAIEGLMVYVWRRHLAAVAGRALSAEDDELSRTDLVVGFADIVGYTATTRHSSATE